MLQQRSPEQFNPMQNSNALNEIAALEQQILTTGRVDSERTSVHDIRLRLYKNEITPDQALAEMYKLISKRQDYN